MAHSNDIISSPVSFADVNAVLGTSHTDLGSLCKDEHINKFARYKPVPYPKIGGITNAERKLAKQGITVEDIVKSRTLSGGAIMDASANDWEYIQPVGGAQQPFRLSDFGNTDIASGYGYYHSAVPPIQVNYPKGGWKYNRGSSSRYMTIYVDLDPDDDIINLQAIDFVSSELNLNEWKLVAYVDSPYFSTHIFTCDDYILSDGDPSGSTIPILIPSGSGSFVADVYICLYRYKDGQYEFMPLPKQGDYNLSPMSLYINDDASESGGGIEGDVFANTTASYALNGEYRSLADFTDGGEAKWALRSSTGNLFFCLKITNKSGSSKTIARTDFHLTMDAYSGAPQYMYNSSKSAISTFTIANNSTVTIYLEWDAALAASSFWNTSNKNNAWSFDITRNGAFLVGSDMYAFKGTDGWVQR